MTEKVELHNYTNFLISGSTVFDFQIYYIEV